MTDAEYRLTDTDASIDSSTSIFQADTTTQVNNVVPPPNTNSPTNNTPQVNNVVPPPNAIGTSTIKAYSSYVTLSGFSLFLFALLI
jgi:hypothetical protein